MSGIYRYFVIVSVLSDVCVVTPQGGKICQRDLFMYNEFVSVTPLENIRRNRKMPPHIVIHRTKWKRLARFTHRPLYLAQYLTINVNCD
jgi:hypothetical protein